MWLRYEAAEIGGTGQFRQTIQHLVVQGESPELNAAAEELSIGLSGLLDRPIAVGSEVRAASVIIGDANSTLVQKQIEPATLRQLGPEGYVLKTVSVAGGTAILIASENGRGTVYGAFHLLRLLQTQTSVESLGIEEKPASPLRLVNHWDNLESDRDTDGLPIKSSFEKGAKRSPDRGLREESIWKWDQLPEQLSPRYRDYARILASVGINGVVVNNVNTSKHGLTGWKLLTAPYIQKLAALAGVFRPYGIRLYISAGFDSPMLIDHLQTADPLDAEVFGWWIRKVDEIYAAIPNFGGFLVKADSEQQPGPLTYHRTHAQGANMLARALKPHGGIVMWRAFVYGSTMKDFPPAVRADRARQAYDFFHPLDGQFAENVVLQVKHGPIDFGLREPVSPLFGAMPHTNLMMEGWDYWAPGGLDAAICYLAPMWKNVLDFDTYSKGPKSTVKRIISGDLNGNPLGGSAMVITVGDVPNWTGQQLHQANIYAYGKLSWNPDASVEEITDEWGRMTFGSDATVAHTVSRLLLESWGIIADYTAPLGLGGPMNGKHNLPPGRETWSGVWPSPETRTKNHGSDSQGTGIDRTSKGTGFVLQYASPVRARFESLATCPADELLFFHHVPYTHRLTSDQTVTPGLYDAEFSSLAGKTVIQSLYDTLFASVERLEKLKQSWVDIRGRIDAERYNDVQEHLQMHLDDARVWRDVMTEYFFSLSGIPDRDGRTGPELGNKK